MAGRVAYYGNITTQGLVLDLDAGRKDSYPRTGTSWIDISGNNNNGTLTNGPTYSDGAIVFDGVNDYVNISSSDTINFGTSNFASNLWIYPFSASLVENREYGVINKNGGFQNSPGWGLELSTWGYSTPFSSIGTIGFNSGQSSWGNSNVSNSIRTEAWSNINLIRTGTRFDLYINGSPASSKTNSDIGININNSIDLTLAKKSTWQYYFKGNISDFTLYNQSLTQHQVWQNFNAMKGRYGIPDIVTDGLVLNLDAGNPYSYLSGSSGTTWTNVSPVSSSISGSLVNGTTYSNGAMVFDGVDDWITLPAGNTFAYGTGDFTIECWFKDTSAISVPYSVLYSQTTNGSNYFILGVGSNQVAWTGTLSGGGTGILASGTYSRNTWNHAVASRISGVVTVYLNGVGGTPTSNTTNFTNTTYVPTIGDESHHGSNNSWTGNISVIRLYTGRGLTSTEITQNFNALRGRYGI